ncbi:MAG: nucleotidyltransferase domain-containing protein, partial [Candidatus Bathyarchaeia archaeon]
MTLTKQVILKRIEENLKRIKGYNVRRLGLFGSYIRDEQKGKSDVDILVEFEEGGKTFDNYMGLKLLLEEILECKVDLVISDSLKPRIKPYVM